MTIRQWKEQSDRSFRICAFGSSNTELSLENRGRHNWVDWFYINVRKEIGNHVSVTNLGIGGETAMDLLGRIGRDVNPLQPSLVIVTIGGNDAGTEVPTTLYAERLKTICSTIREYQAVPVLQTYYCPLYHQSPPGFRARFEANMQVNRDISSEWDIPLVDQYGYFEPLYHNDPETYEKLMRDWLHVNPLGNLVMGQFLSASFGLPPIPVPEDMQQEFNPLYEKMNALAIR
ncbi:lysophospholipase L1-like esterase [Fontibacillus phaseoli]|uniref:Lysophospholipase L1-like esterase n=1 Tax=Fontibacillus phaseoli TaxID=1416533 RepID=A0A369BB17_9BACL|nr:SGNH/GDSL hydrolase family protein [Fontibacillus phaseoli]RCX17697.1 lysophospholipase L1-like esterase [Fontibacillus phaseoli]